VIKNLTVNNQSNYKIYKPAIHNIVSHLKNEMDFRIQFMVINFLTADQIIPINTKYLDHNYSTDIITFNYSGENYTLDGEIFISLDDASFYAKKYGISLENELLRLIIHGLLHLKGYDDKSTNDKRKMKRLENMYVNKYLNYLNNLIR